MSESIGQDFAGHLLSQLNLVKIEHLWGQLQSYLLLDKQMMFTLEVKIWTF